MNDEHRRVVAGVSPVDYRPPVISWAAGEALARGAELRLVTAVPTRSAAERPRSAEAAEHVATEYPRLLVTSETIFGAPAEVLWHAATSADVLVVGADDQSPFAEAITGSVPGSLLTTSPCPLVVVPQAAGHAPADAPVVAALDDAGTSHAALAYAFAAADRCRRRLALLRCLPAERPDTPTAESVALNGFRGLYPAVAVTEETATGDPTDVLARWSRRSLLLVLGSRGHGRLTTTLFGSVSRTLIRRSGCPIVVARRARMPEPESSSLVPGNG